MNQADFDSKPLLLTRSQVREILGVGRKQLEAMIDRKAIEPVRLTDNGRMMFRKWQLAAILKLRS